MVVNLLQIVFGLSKDVSNVRCFICLLYPFIPSCLSNVVTRESLRFLSSLLIQEKAYAFSLFVFLFVFLFYFYFFFFLFRVYIYETRNDLSSEVITERGGE